MMLAGTPCRESTRPVCRHRPRRENVPLVLLARCHQPWSPRRQPPHSHSRRAPGGRGRLCSLGQSQVQVRLHLEGRVPLGKLGAAPHHSAGPQVSLSGRGHGNCGPPCPAEQTIPRAHTARVALMSETAVQACSLSALHPFSGDRRGTGCTAFLFRSALTGCPEPAGHSEACPGRGRLGSPLRTDVEKLRTGTTHHPA